MKRDKKLWREILAKIESLPIKPGEAWHITLDDIAIDGYATDDVEYNLGLLKEGGYLACVGSQPMIGTILSGLTNLGHDFLDEAAEESDEVEDEMQTRISPAGRDPVDPFAEYDELAENVARSSYQFFAGNLRRWFEMLDRTPVFARPILQRLETRVDFPTWFEPYRRRLMGVGITVQGIEWPQERTKRLGIQLLLFRRFADGTVSAQDFGFVVLNSGSNVDNSIRKVVEQMYLPFSRELRRYLGEMADQQQLAGSERKVSDAAPDEENGSIGDQHAPAADRFVSFDHNSASYKEADVALERLAEAVRGSNELFASPEDRIAVAEEVGAIRTLIARASVRLVAIKEAAERGVLPWLAKEAASGVVRALAGLAVTALIGLVALHLSR